MLPFSTTKDWASELLRRYKRDDLVRLRARKYCNNPLTSPSSLSLALADDLSLLDPYDISPYASPLWSPLCRRYSRASNYIISSRKGLPDVPSRTLYNKRLADVFAEQQEASRRADALILADYLSNRAILPSSIPEEELGLIAYDDAPTANTEEDANDNDDVTEVDENEEDARKKRAAEKDACKERVKILSQIRSYKRRFGPSSGIVTRSLNRYLYDM